MFISFKKTQQMYVSIYSGFLLVHDTKTGAFSCPMAIFYFR